MSQFRSALAAGYRPTEGSEIIAARIAARAAEAEGARVAEVERSAAVGWNHVLETSAA